MKKGKAMSLVFNTSSKEFKDYLDYASSEAPSFVIFNGQSGLWIDKETYKEKAN